MSICFQPEHCPIDTRVGEHFDRCKVSRLSCQAKVGDEDLVIEIPKYTINYEREGGAKK